MIIDGKAIAAVLYEELQKERAEFDGEVSLGMLVGDKNPVTYSYVTIKKNSADKLRVKMVRRELKDGATTEDAVKAMQELARDTNGVIPQLPMTMVDSKAVIAAMPKEKDVDVLGSAAYAEFEKGNWPAIPPVSAALVHILKVGGIDICGKKVVSLGRGRLVGKPSAVYFAQLGAEVVLLGKGDDITLHTRTADIIILGAGVPGILKPDMVKDGVAIVDAGTSELGGKVVGDADPAIAEKCSLFTPVPGGVGPVAIAMIYKNLFALKRAMG